MLDESRRRDYLPGGLRNTAKASRGGLDLPGCRLVRQAAPTTPGGCW